MVTLEQARDEALFWLAQQDREHLLLTALGVELGSVRQEAARLASAYEAAGAAGDVRQLISIAKASQAVKRAALEGARAGWVGWLYPSLLEHMIEEVDHALLRMHRTVDPRDTVAFWAKERSSAAGAAARYLDPSVGGAATKLYNYHAQLRDLHAAARRPSAGNVAQNVLNFTQPLDQFLQQSMREGIQTIAPPMLLAHELREGALAEAMLADVAGQTTPSAERTLRDLGTGLSQAEKTGLVPRNAGLVPRNAG